MSGFRTTITKLPEEGWVDLGPGPALVGAVGAALLFSVGDEEPDPGDIGFVIRYDAPPLPVASRTKLWARACPGGGGRSRVIVAPLDPPTIAGRP